jgi:uncharacterized paraquat-inducible protein A
MPRHVDEWDEESWDDEEPDEPDDDEDDDTIPCPYCKKPVHEDAQRCPHCESYISAEDAPPTRKPWWIVVGAVAVLAVVYMWITAGR